MPVLQIKFDRHGLGDCVHFAHALQLYKRRGYDITVQAEGNKRFVWDVAGVNVVHSGDLPDHPYLYPARFEDLGQPDSEQNKVAFGLTHSAMPKLALSAEDLWDELCAVRLSAHEFIPPEAHAEADAFLAGLPRPLICLHSRGTNWHERKSLAAGVAFDVILKLIERTGGSVIVLDFDQRAPMVGSDHCKGIKPGWGHIGIDRLCALYERCDLMIGVDSGPFHVAAMTHIKSLGVFRSLHPCRVCLPNPHATYLASDQWEVEWEQRKGLWKITTYAGTEPTADDIVRAAEAVLSGAAPVSQADRRNLLARLAGRYRYRRIGYDERILWLESDGTISEGADGCERNWSVCWMEGVDAIEISGKDGVICRCRADQGLYRGQWTQFERMPIELVPIAESPFSLSSATSVTGEYFCEVIGLREFRVTLQSDGQAITDDESVTRWSSANDQLRLSRDSAVMATLRLETDGCWRGLSDAGKQVELIPASRQPFRSFGPTRPIEYRKGEYSYISLDQFHADCISFARKLPPIQAIAGIPRSGLLAASLVALELNCPMISLESLLEGKLPTVPVPRRGRGVRVQQDGMILVIDDNCSSGRVIASLRPKLHPDVKIGVIHGNDHADYLGRPLEREIHRSYEWTILHDDNAEYTLTDLDGVLCEDWTGGSETANEAAYQSFLNNGVPRRIPAYPLLGIVTNRLERDRGPTEDWLKRHGIRYQSLTMSPHPTYESRDAAGDAATRKAAVYADHPRARLFIESCGQQAREIKRLTGRPVLSIEDNALV